VISFNYYVGAGLWGLASALMISRVTRRRVIGSDAAIGVITTASFALGLVAHAAMESRQPVLLFSLEMSHLELSQRLLCAEARVDATRMRNGRLLESDWPKISTAIGHLGEAPIFIDDNPNITVMDITVMDLTFHSTLPEVLRNG